MDATRMARASEREAARAASCSVASMSSPSVTGTTASSLPWTMKTGHLHFFSHGVDRYTSQPLITSATHLLPVSTRTALVIGTWSISPRNARVDAR
jgi:hypothetical protein